MSKRFHAQDFNWTEEQIKRCLFNQLSLFDFSRTLNPQVENLLTIYRHSKKCTLYILNVDKFYLLLFLRASSWKTRSEKITLF